MKQSTKLLSLVLALIMAFSCMTVIGNAAIIESEVNYDSIDDASLSPKQVAGIALDLVDDLLIDADLGVINIVVVELDLTSIDGILQSLIDIDGNLLWDLVKGMAKNVGALNFAPLKNGDRAWQRSDGDINVIRALLAFIGDTTNSEILSRVAYGLGEGGKTNSNGDLTNTAQLDLGIISSLISLGSIGDILGDIPGMLKELVYDLIVYGSYKEGYPNNSYPSVEDLAGNPLPADMDTFDEMVDNALLNLIIHPQDFEYVDKDGDGKNETKEWDMGSIISPSFAADVKAGKISIADVTPRAHSLFTILDKIAQYAIDDMGVNALNNNLKKALMEAVEIDLNEINISDLPADVYADFEVDKEDGEESYVSYIAYDRMKSSGGDYYYTTLKSVPTVDASGKPVTDKDGNELSHKERKFFKANMLSGNDFAKLINWDWQFVDSKTTPKEGEIQLLYSNIVKDYDGDGTKSIVEGINDLLKLVYDVALTDKTKASFEKLVGTGYVAGSNANLMTNVNNIAKYLLSEHGELVFGSTSPYAHLDYEKDLKKLDTVDLIALIGPGFFEDVMPQIIFPKNADGTYAFHDGVQIYEFGALVIREFISDITPNVNYDQYIFANGDVTSANDRQLKVQGADQWFNLILNMGVDIGYTYLYNITNFGDVYTFDKDGNFTAKTKRSSDNSIPALPAVNGTNAYDDTRWTAMLDTAIIWAARYVGGYTGTSVIDGLDVTSISNVQGPLNKLSYILNRLLPLGFINGYSTNDYAFDVNSFVMNGLKPFFTDFDLARVLGLLGRNMHAKHHNILADGNLVTSVLNLVNGVLGLIFRDDNTGDAYDSRILRCNENTSSAAQSIDAVVSQANLKITVGLLLRRLSASATPVVVNALPVVGKFIKGWGTEQAFDVPEIDIDETVIVNADGDTRNGFDVGDVMGGECNKDVIGHTYTPKASSPYTVSVSNTANGLWRHYIDPSTGESKKDQQYRVELVDVNVYNVDGEPSSYVQKPSVVEANAPYGGAATFQFDYGTEASPEKDHNTGDYVVQGPGLQDIPAKGAIVRFDVKYKVYGEDGKAYLNGATFIERKFVNFTYESDEGREDTNAKTDKHYIAITSPRYIPYSSAVEAMKGTTVVSLWRKGDTLAKKDYKVEPQTNGFYGFNMGGFSVTLEDKNYSDIELQLFNSYEAKLPYAAGTAGAIFGGDSGTTTANINGSVPTQEDFEKALAYKTVQTQGATATWSVKITGNDTATGNFVVKFFDDEYRNRLIDIANDENNAMRLAANYYTDGTVVYADRLLEDEVTYDDDGNEILPETNSSATAWVDPYGNVVADASVTVDKKNEALGTCVIDGEDVTVRKVTKFVASEVWNEYIKTLEAGMKVAYQTWNGNSEYNFKKYYDPLRIAANDVEYIKNTASASAVGDAIDDLKVKLADVEAETTDIKDYTDYRMYRLNRLNDARDDANYYISLKNDASNATVAEIDESFPYTWIEEDDLRALVAGNDTLSGYTGGTDKANLVLSLLEPLSDEEVASKAQWLKDRKNEYASISDLDVELTSVLLTLSKDRLLTRSTSVYTKYLQDEVTSINNMILNIQNSSDEDYDRVSAMYTWRSWTKFEDAYWAAIDALDNPTQKAVFDAKWELMCCRNELVLVDDEADYSELEALIEQAEYALGNQNLYNNTAKELGQVLAELGIDEEITNADGDVINLFPGSAYYVNSEPYTVDDQDVVDRKAEELKEALARLKFKGLSITDKNGNANTSTGILVEGDEAKGIEAVTATIANIAPEMGADDVKALFTVAATSAGTVDITVSNDLYYTVETKLAGFAGTNSVVTFYTTTDDGVKIPVATVKLIVNGDINGDGAVDVLDGAYAQLVSTQKAELEGCYLLAGDLSGNDRKVEAADYSEVVNLIVA